MDGKTHAGGLFGVFLLFVVVSAVLTLPAQAKSVAQTTATPLHEPEATGLLVGEEMLEVELALDEARRETGRMIQVDVVVDETGRRVSTDWTVYAERDGSAYAKETPMPVMAEDVNRPGDVVILVDPYENKGSFVEAPGLSEGEARRISEAMTAGFRREGYAEGLVEASDELRDRLPKPGEPGDPPEPVRVPGVEHRDLEDLLEDRLRELRGTAAERLRPGPGDSGVAVALVCAATAAVLLLLSLFLKKERYRRPEEPERDAAFLRLRRAAEEEVSALAPKMLALAEKEKAVALLLEAAGDEDCGEAGHLVREVAGFWRRFNDASALIEVDPGRALEELRRLPPLAGAALGKLEEAEKALAGEDGCREDTTGG